MKKIIALALVAIMLVLSLTACEVDEEESVETTSSTNSSATAAPTEKPTWAPHDAPKAEDIDFSQLTTLYGVNESATETDYVKITVKDFGEIVIRLYPDVAPLTVQNFKKLVSEKFYDGLIFHRVIKNFVIQGGDPLGTGYGGSSANVRGEFSENGFENNLSHRQGVIAMARGGSDMDSASSQFYICHKSRTDLDGKYATFGYTVYGFEVVDAIARVTTDTSDKPKTDVVIESIRFVTLPETTVTK